MGNKRGGDASFGASIVPAGTAAKNGLHVGAACGGVGREGGREGGRAGVAPSSRHLISGEL